MSFGRCSADSGRNPVLISPSILHHKSTIFEPHNQSFREHIVVADNEAVYGTCKRNLTLKDLLTPTWTDLHPKWHFWLLSRLRCCRVLNYLIHIRESIHVAIISINLIQSARFLGGWIFQLGEGERNFMFGIFHTFYHCIHIYILMQIIIDFGFRWILRQRHLRATVPSNGQFQQV